MRAWPMRAGPIGAQWTTLCSQDTVRTYNLAWGHIYVNVHSYIYAHIYIYAHVKACMHALYLAYTYGYAYVIL